MFEKVLNKQLLIYFKFYLLLVLLLALSTFFRLVSIGRYQQRSVTSVNLKTPPPPLQPTKSIPSQLVFRVFYNH